MFIYAYICTPVPIFRHVGRRPLKRPCSACCVPHPLNLRRPMPETLLPTPIPTCTTTSCTVHQGRRYLPKVARFRQAPPLPIPFPILASTQLNSTFRAPSLLHISMAGLFSLPQSTHCPPPVCSSCDRWFPSVPAIDHHGALTILPPPGRLVEPA